MCGLFKTISIAILFWWICVTGKVEAHYSDALSLLSPVRAEVDVWRQRNSRLANKNNLKLACEKPHIYICEEPPFIVPPDASKICNYRNQRYHEQVYRWVAGRGCLLYTPDFLFVGGSNTLNLNAGCFYADLYAPCLEIAKEDGSCGCYPFDPGLEEVASAVRDALVPAAHGRWERCFYNAAACCSHYMFENSTYSENECESTFDGWTCWQPAEAGTVATEVCSEFAYSGQGPSCHHFSSKNCYANATWEIQTDYTTCSITPRLLRRYRFYIAMLSFSIISCLPAVVVFFFYKRLRKNTRVVLHRNLLMAIILRNVLVIVSRSEIYIDELTNSGDTVMSTHSIACRVLAVAERASGNLVFVCMLVEGIYLHRLIVAVFRKSLNINILYLIAAVITVAPVGAWAWVMAVNDNHSCWLVYTVNYVQWILDGPRIAILLVNFGLFLDVLRVLLTKVRNSENANQLNTTKATLFLMPIFGVQFLLTAFRPNTNNCTGEQTYYYVSYTVEGLQGFIVAMLYCYVNKEVHVLVKATYKKTENAVVSRVRRDSAYPKMSFASDERKMTYSTALPTHNEDFKDQYATIRPKLHVAEIISIQASERLAEILEPVYETIGNGISNEGYDSLERSEADTDSGFIPQALQEDYYGFTNASSISIDCQDWIRHVSPSHSVYENENNFVDFDALKFLEDNNLPRCSNNNRLPTYNRAKSDIDNMHVQDYNEVNLSEIEANTAIPHSSASIYATAKSSIDTQLSTPHTHERPVSLYDDCKNMLDEIMQCMDTGHRTSRGEVVLNPYNLDRSSEADC